MLSDSEIMAKQRDEIIKLQKDTNEAQARLIGNMAKLEALALRSGELERSAQLVASQAAELCRQLRGGSMEHLKTTP